MARIAAMALALGLGPAAGAHAWLGEPVELTPAGYGAVPAVSPNGHAIVAWTAKQGWDTGTFRVHVVPRLPGGGFGPSQQVGDGRAHLAGVAIGEDGTAAVLVRNSAGDFISVREGPAGEFGSLEPIPGDDEDHAELVVGPDGVVTVAWTAEGDVLVADRPRGGTLSVVHEVPPPPPTVSQHNSHLARDGLGNAFLTWHYAAGFDKDTGGTRILSSYRPLGGDFGSPQVVAGGTDVTQILADSLVAGADRTAVAMWDVYDGHAEGQRRQGAAVFRDGGWRRAPEVLEDWSFPGWVATVGADGSAAALIWPSFLDPFEAYAPPGGDLGAFRPHPTPVPPIQEIERTECCIGGGPRSPDMRGAALDPGGRLVTMWLEHENPGYSLAGRILGVLRRRDGSTCEPTVVSWGNADWTWVSLAFDDAGGGLATWSDGGRAFVAPYTGSDECPPPFDGPLHQEPSQLAEHPPPADQPPPLPAGDHGTSLALAAPAHLAVSPLVRASRDRRRGVITLRCRGTGRCRGTLSASARRRRFDVGPRRPARVSVPLARPLRRQLRRSGRGRLRVLVATAQARRVLTLRVVARRAR